MRQGNGTDLLGMNDPRSATIGVIYVAPDDDRKSVLAAILTQEKLNRKHIVIVLPGSMNKAFQSAQDFDDLKGVRRKLQGELIFIASGPGPADFALQRRFPVYSSLESYAESLGADEGDQQDAEQVPPSDEKKSRLFGSKGRSAAADAAIAGAAGGAVASELSQKRQNAKNPQTTGLSATPVPEPSAGSRTPFSTMPMRPRDQGTQQISRTPHQGMLDDEDDDDLGDVGSSAGRAAGAAAFGGATGYVSAERARQQGQMASSAATPEEDDEDWEEIPPGPVSRASATSPRGISQQPEDIDSDDVDSNGGGPGIIDLQPKRPGRSTLKLNEHAAGPFRAPETPSTGPKRRRTGSMATGAVAAGAALGAAAAVHNAGGGSQSASASSQRGAAGGSSPQRFVTPPRRVRGGSGSGGRRRRGWVVIAVLLVLLLLCFGVCALAAPASFQNAIVNPISGILPAGVVVNPVTVSITPNSQVVQDSYVIQAVMQNPQASQQQVSMQSLQALPASQSVTVTGTGHTQTAAVAAKGTLTFINGSATAMTISTSETVFHSNGIGFVPDGALVVVPAADPIAGTFGRKTVTAHAVNGGVAGNIAAGAISGTCCVTGGAITVSNGAFSGGQDPQSYTFVSQDDVNNAAVPLVTKLSQQEQADFNKQLKPNQKLVGNPSCSKNVSAPDGTVGDQGHNVASTQVTVSATCTGIAYDNAGAQSIATTRLQQQANKKPGPGYALVGNVVTTIASVTRQTNSVALLVNAQGVWAYQFTDAQKQAIAHAIAGKKLSDANRILNNQSGVKSGTIKLDRGDTLPTNVNQITINVQNVAGESNSPAASNSNPPVNQPASSATPVPGNGMVPENNLKG